MSDEQPTRQHTMVGVWTAIGIGVGTSLGVALDAAPWWIWDHPGATERAPS